MNQMSCVMSAVAKYPGLYLQFPSYSYSLICTIQLIGCFFSDIGKENHWKNHYTGEDVDTSLGAVSGQLAGGRSKNCGQMVPDWGGWTDWFCSTYKANYLTCVCEHPQQMYLQLRGICPESNIDRLFIPRNMEHSGGVHLISLRTNMIKYDKNMLSWKLTEPFKNTTAVSNAPLASYALGAHEWVIENDSLECSSQGEPYKTRLKLSGCWEGEFTCNDGQCIRDCSS